MKRLCALALLSGLPALASGTAAWEMNTYADFVRGRFQGVSLNRDGQLTLAPRLDTLFASDQPVIWATVRTTGGEVYVATGHRGRLFRVDASGKGSLVWTAPQPEVFTLAAGPRGEVYAGSSPDGRVWRIENGKCVEYFNPQAKYIWSLAVAGDGTLYVGTGDQGRIFRVTGAGKGEPYYDTGQSHVTSLALDSQGRLLAGTEPNGILYRVTAKDKAFALYDSGLPEIRAIVPAADGSVYAAALGGSIVNRIQGAAQGAEAPGAAVSTAAPTTITVEANAQSGAEIKPPQPDAAKTQAAPPPTPQVTTQFSTAVDLAGVEKSAVYRINPDNTVETLWTSKEENVYDILKEPDRLLLATDGGGRVYALSPDRKVTLLAETNEGETTRLLGTGGGVLAATGNMGRLYRLGEGPGGSGSYESPVYDTGTASRWGALSWHADMAAGAELKLQVRSGNSGKPDKSWSDWSAPISASGTKVPSPNARYIQWRAMLAGATGGPVIDNVTVAYLPQNSPPVVRTITVTTQAATSGGAAKPTAQASAAAAYTVTVSDTGDSSVATASGTPTTVLSRAVNPQINVTWQAEDPDGDRLVYAVFFRGEGEREWKPLKANLHENTLSFDGDALADGKYYFRVLASDREANPPSSARSGELTSAPVMIDNTPPVVTIGTVLRTAAGVTIEFDAADAASPLRRAEYSVDAATWVPAESADGVIDSPREHFVLELRNVSPGEHLVVVRAVDSCDNTGLAKVVLR